ncbi:MAG: PilZ domain-containing protein [Magnetococcales bacterium]|nr:PilZ domain-containing protein [Magnetococcales bacterium]
MTESDNDGVTFVNIRGTSARGVAKGTAGDGVQDRRRFPRPQFRSASLLTMKSGLLIAGTTEDVSYQGIRFNPDMKTDPSQSLRKNDLGMIRISLNPLLPLHECYVDMNCRVVRIEADFIALQIEPPQDTEPVDPLYPKIFVRRSNGILEPGWEILPQNIVLPKDVQKRIRRHEEKYAEHGPVAVVCRKRGGKPEDDLYKLHNIQYLKEVQEFATRDQSPDKVYDPPTGWSENR